MPDDETPVPCPSCGSLETVREETHHGTHTQPGSSNGCDFSVDTILCKSCGEKFAD